MARAGDFRERATFERLSLSGNDGYGNVQTTWRHLLTVWADLLETPGREVLSAGGVDASATGTLRVRHSTAAADITAADRIVMRGHYWAIIAAPGQIGRAPHVLEFRIRRGEAV